MNPRHPVYIISKGRWKTRRTARALDLLGIPYSIVVEPQEHDEYQRALAEPGGAGAMRGLDPWGRPLVVTLPFANLGAGSIPVRNWVWSHAKSLGATHHWVLDDNIRAFYRLNRNLKTYVLDGTVFYAAEDFVHRYDNVAEAGFNCSTFPRERAPAPPFYLNTRIYSCVLLRNDLYDASTQWAREQMAEPEMPGKFMWRGRYNEDTDLSLRLLKAGYCTLLFNAFLCEKSMTMVMSGGNTELLYANDGRLKMAESLAAQHPDVARVSYRWGRPQHVVNYRPFRDNKLKLRPGVAEQLARMPPVDNYGMKLQELVEHPPGVRRWVDCPPDWPNRRSYAEEYKRAHPL